MKKIIFFCSLFLFISVCKINSQSITWSETQPAGNVDMNWVTTSMSSDGSKLIAGVNGGRLYISTNGGNSWLETQPIGNIGGGWWTTSMSSDGSKIIAGSMGGRLYISSNGGNSWSETQPAGDVNKNWYTTSMNSDGSELIAGVDGGRLYISTNGGSSWTETQPAGDADERWWTTSISSDGSKLIAGGWGVNLYISTDSGSSWSKIQSAVNPDWSTTSMSSDGSKMVAGGWRIGRLYISTNSGSSWIEKQPAGNVDKYWKASSISSDGSRLIAGVYMGRLYFSTFGGSSWNETHPDGCSADTNWFTSSMSSDGSKLIAGVKGGRLYLGNESLTAGDTDSLIFFVNMSVYTQLNQFNPSTDSVFVRGDFQTLAGDSANWAGTKFNMIKMPGDSIYSLAVIIPKTYEGQSIQYKFVARHNGNDYWENIDNRVYTLTTDLLQPLPQVYFNNIYSYGSTHIITFKADMSSLISQGFNPLTDSIEVRGDTPPLNWGPGILLQQDQNNQNIFYTNVAISAGAGTQVQWKFHVDPESKFYNSGWENIVNNRVFTFPQQDSVIGPIQPDIAVIGQPLTVTVYPGEGTLSSAINYYPSGSILQLIPGGIYTESNNYNFGTLIDKKLAILVPGNNQQKAVLRIYKNPTSQNLVDFFELGNNSSLTLSGLELDGTALGTPNSNSIIHFYVEALQQNTIINKIKIDNCLIHDFLYHVIDGGNPADSGNVVIDSTIIDNCIIHNMATTLFFKYVGANYVSLTNSTIYNILSYGFRITGPGMNGKPNNTPEVFIDHTTWYNIGISDPREILLLEHGPNLKRWLVTNSIFVKQVGKTKTVINLKEMVDSTLATISNICLWDVGVIKWFGHTVSDTISKNPEFKFSENGDFTLPQGSSLLTFANNGSAIGDPRWFINPYKKLNLISIAEARNRIGDTVLVSGVVISPNYQTGNRAYYIWDGTGGIQMIRFGLTSPDLKLGDSIMIAGPISIYNGLTQISPISDGDIVVVGSNKDLPAPQRISIHEYNTNSENYESHLIEFSNLTKISGTWPASQSNKILLLTDGTDTLTMYIDSDTKLYNYPEPTWPENVIGIGTQFSTTGIGGYELLPRYITDFQLPTDNAIVLIDTIGASQGDTLLIALNARNLSNIGAITLKIKFDQSALQWTGVTDWNNQITGALAYAVGDTLAISWSSVTAINISDGRIADLKFLCNKLDSTVSLNFIRNLCEISDEESNVIPVDYSDGAVLPGVAIGGTVSYLNSLSTPLNNVSVFLTGRSNKTAITNADGYYFFNGLLRGDYHLQVSNPGPWLGANATDALIVQRHTVQLEHLTGINILAGDVNLSSQINSTDALLILMRNTGIIDSFQSGDWIFEQRDVKIQENSADVDIKGLCYGDVNGSNNPGGIGKTESLIAVTNDGTLKINPKDRFQIPVEATGDLNIGALTLKIKYPANLVELEGVTSKLKDVLSKSDKGIIKIGWFNLSPASFKNGEALVNLNFKPKEQFNEVAEFKLSIESGSEFADSSASIIKGMKINIPMLETAVPKEYSLSQNYPNPFNPSTIINYDLPEQAHVTIEVFNVLGERVKTLENSIKESGSYKIEMNADKLASGIYIYRIIAHGKKNFTQVKKMILLK